mgnify:CR=1 FL=1
MEGRVHQMPTGQATTPSQQAPIAQAKASSQLQHCAHTPFTGLPPFSELADPATAAPHWRSWIGRLRHYFRTARETHGAVQRSLMLHLGGAELYELFEHLPNTGSETDFEAAVMALNTLQPQLNPDYERFKL